MPPVTPSRTRDMAKSCLPVTGTADPRYSALLRVLVLEHALGDFLEGHGQVVLRSALDERRQVVAEGALAELVVVVVDLPGALRSHDHERIPRVHVLQPVVDAGFDHRRGMVAAGASRPETSRTSSATARTRSSFSIT